MEANELREMYLNSVVELAKDLTSDEEVKHLCSEKGVSSKKWLRALRGDEVHSDDMFSTTLAEDELLEQLELDDEATKKTVKNVLEMTQRYIRNEGFDAETDDREMAFKAAIYRYIRDSQK